MKFVFAIFMLVCTVAIAEGLGCGCGGKLLLKADNGKYLARINRGEGLDPIEVAKSTPDVFCEFTIHQTETEGIVMLKADNGKYLSRINRGPGLDPIEASKSTPDVFCRFQVVSASVRSRKTDRTLG